MKQLFGRPGQAHIAVDVLSAYLDHQVSPADRAYVENHLQGCAACRSELTSLRRTVLALHALPRVPVPRAFTLSEAQVGIRRPADRPAWFGGLARGLGAVTALALVAVVAATLLRPRAWAPGATVARSAPTAAIAETLVEKAVEQAAAPQAEPAALAQPAAVEPPETEQPLAIAQEAAAPTLEPEAAPLPADQPAAKVAVAPVVTETAEATMFAMAPPAPEATPDAAASGRGGGGAGAAEVLPPEVLVPEATPPTASASQVLPADARLVYADLKALWAIDRAAGLRQLVTVEGVNTPLLSSDRAWVVYRTLRQDTVELWAVRWDGGAPRLLFNERDLPTTGLDAAHTERRISDVRWVPGQLTLALTLVAVPASTLSDALPEFELWHLDLESGALRYVVELGRALRPVYAPDGAQFALLEYGTETNPQGSLRLFNADGSNQRVVLQFAAGPGRLSYDAQIAWLPDSSAVLLAIPDADGPLSSTTLYRVSAAGRAQVIGRVDAFQVAWSLDGSRLAWTRFTSDTPEAGELYLANADGSAARRYMALKNGVFLNWAPDGLHFLYQDDFQTYVGATGQAPQRLGTSVSFFDPRWVSATQFVSLHDTGAGWLLTLRGLNGDAYSLQSLPREAMLDVSRP